MPGSVYEIIELVGTSTESLENATANAIKQHRKLRDHRIVEVVMINVQIEDEKIYSCRPNIKLSLKSHWMSDRSGRQPGERKSRQCLAFSLKIVCFFEVPITWEPDIHGQL